VCPRRQRPPSKLLALAVPKDDVGQQRRNWAFQTISRKPYNPARHVSAFPLALPGFRQ
jgi:hypothetical protein